jgi:hypothetical protein
MEWTATNLIVQVVAGFAGAHFAAIAVLGAIAMAAVGFLVNAETAKD